MNNPGLDGVKKLPRCDVCSNQSDGVNVEKVLGRTLCGACVDRWVTSAERKRGIVLDVAHLDACYLEFKNRRQAELRQECESRTGGSN